MKWLSYALSIINNYYEQHGPETLDTIIVAAEPPPW